MELEYKESISVQEYNALRMSVGWDKLLEEQVKLSLDNSSYIASCYDGERIVGTARIVWDHGPAVYLASVMVVPAYQGKGIGHRLVEMTIEYLRAQLKEGWKIQMVLQSSKGKEDFYKKLGFSQKPSEHSGAGMDLWIK